jgi:hypothetical protein
VPDGEWAGGRAHTFPHILPEGNGHNNLHPAIQHAALEYCATNGIALHRDFANLRSSQACCFNFLFPLRLNPAEAVIALAPLLPGVTTVDLIEFEYTGPDAEGATRWLGEPPGGGRGQNRTSADAAVWWHDGDDQGRLTLVEWKYTERQFGTCGGFASRGNDHEDKCMRWPCEGFAPLEDCYLARGDTSRNQRQYWSHLDQAGIMLHRYHGQACPFIGPFYQLMRLHLLAAYSAQAGVADRADVAVVYFEGNDSLKTTPPELRHLGEHVESAWRGLLRRGDDFRACSAEDLAAGIKSVDPALGGYLTERYGV